MKVLVIGGGGREHAVCKKLSESKDVTEILCAPGNAGIAQVARCIPEVKATDIEGIVALAQREKVDFVCVTPDDPLALGCVDKLEAAGATVYHAGTRLTDAGYVTAGGRVLGVTALGDTLAEAIRRAYAAAEKIHFEGAHMRRDIGSRDME